MTNITHHLLEATAPSTDNPLEELGAIEHDNAEQATTITSSFEEMAPHELLESAMDQARHDANIHDLLQKLQQKLGLNEHDYHQVSPLRTSETASTSHSEAAHNSQEHISVVDRIHEDSGGHQKSLNNDTIILVCSLVVMIIIGITFHRIISYFAQVRSRRRACRRGLKQLGEHMHIVTRTISNPPSVDPTPTGTPTISMRKLALLNNNRIAQSDVPPNAAGLGSAKPRARSPLPVPSDDDSVFKPSTHVMRREDSELGVLTTAAHLHHIEHLQDHQPHHQHHHNR